MANEHAFRQFNQDLKGEDFAPVVFMFGAEEYLTEWAVKALVSKYVNEACREMDFIKLDEQPKVDEFISVAETFSMFSERKVVWVKDYNPLLKQRVAGFTDSDLLNIKNYINEPNPGTIVIFSAAAPEAKAELTKLLKKTVRCYDFSPLDNATLFGFVQKRFAAQNAAISKQLVNFFITESGYFNRESEYTLYRLVNDVNKIVAHAQGNEITEEDITRTLQGDEDTFIFDFLDAISNNKKEQAFTMLHNILASGKDVFALASRLIDHFEILLEVSEFRAKGYSLPMITKTLGIHEFRVKKAMALSDRFPVAKLKKTLIRLYEIDRNVKSGDIDGTIALELLVASV